ncbi:MAG: CoA-binding protein [Candidatus Helarchaeota archaeon]
MDFERLINPKTVALIGASKNRRQGSYRFLESWIANKFRGKIFPINPKYKKIQGLKTYPDIRDVPADYDIDYALIAVPAAKVPREIEKCVDRNIKFVVIFSSGFGEVGKGELEAEILRIAKGKIRILGPNCIGVYSTEARLGYFVDQPIADEGNISFISQSGGIARKFIWSSYGGFPVRATVSTGNTIDISITELLNYFARDPKTHIIGAYLESIKNGQEFFALLKKITLKKPVVILKTGRTVKGKVAARSHTGAITGSYEIFASLVKQAGGILVETLEELTDVILGLKTLGNMLPQGNRTAIINTGGGIAVEMTDICESMNFIVSNLESTTQHQLQKLLPAVNTIIENPIDLGGAGFDPNLLGNMIKNLSEDQNIDLILSVHEIERFQALNNYFQVTDISKAYTQVMRDNRNPLKPIISILPRSWEAIDHFITYQNYRHNLLEANIPSYPTTQRALKMLTKLIQYKRFLKKF